MNCPEKWEAVGNGCQNLQALLLSDPAVVTVHRMLATEVRLRGFESGAKMLFDRERKERPQTSRQLKAYVLGKIRLEDLEIGQAAWAVMRLQCACDFLGQMFPPLSKDDPCTEMAAHWTAETACVWLLTELWERRHDSWLKLVAMEWAGPFPFYGVEPVPEWL